jgi:hypothetical protein
MQLLSEVRKLFLAGMRHRLSLPIKATRESNFTSSVHFGASAPDEYINILLNLYYTPDARNYGPVAENERLPF